MDGPCAWNTSDYDHHLWIKLCFQAHTDRIIDISMGSVKCEASECTDWSFCLMAFSEMTWGFYSLGPQCCVNTALICGVSLGSWLEGWRVLSEQHKVSRCCPCFSWVTDERPFSLFYSHRKFIILPVSLHEGECRVLLFRWGLQYLAN